MGIFSILTTTDGKIPLLQIVIGIVVGIIGTLLYLKFYKQVSSKGDTSEKVKIGENFAPELVGVSDLPKIPLSVPQEELPDIQESGGEEVGEGDMGGECGGVEEGGVSISSLL